MKLSGPSVYVLLDLLEQVNAENAARERKARGRRRRRK